MKRSNKDRRLAAFIAAWGVFFVLAVAFIGYCQETGENQPEKNRLMKQTQYQQLLELDK